MGTDGMKNDATGRPDMGLRLAVLSRGPRLYSTRRIVEEAKKRGLDVEVCDPMKFSLVVNQGSVDVLHRGRAFAKDAVIPRIGHSITQHGVAVLRPSQNVGGVSAETRQGIPPSSAKTKTPQNSDRQPIHGSQNG